VFPSVPAGKFLAHMLDDFPAPRLAFERFGHSLAEFAQVRTAAFAADARHRIDDALARKIVSGRRAGLIPVRSRFSFRFSGAAISALASSSAPLISDGEFKPLDELLSALRGLTELLPPGPGEHEFQPLDLKRPNRRLAARFR
jgi:hypothetical protein